MSNETKIITGFERIHLKKNRFDSLVLLGGFAILLDTVWGAVATLGLDWRQTNELMLGISLVLGAPMYLLDMWLNKRIAISLLGLFLFRWVVRCFGGPTPIFCNALSGSVLLVSSFALLQWHKLKKKQ